MISASESRQHTGDIQSAFLSKKQTPNNIHALAGGAPLATPAVVSRIVRWKMIPGYIYI
jgi:hypothetical protein